MVFAFYYCQMQYNAISGCMMGRFTWYTCSLMFQLVSPCTNTIDRGVLEFELPPESSESEDLEDVVQQSDSSSDSTYVRLARPPKRICMSTSYFC